jgi:hypothetical protein
VAIRDQEGRELVMISKPALHAKVREVVPTKLGVVLGLKNGRIEQSRKYVYIDHSYFVRGWEFSNFRLIRDAVHLTRIVPHPTDRLKTVFNVDLKDYRKNGSHILLIEPGKALQGFYGKPNIVQESINLIRQHTDRPIVIKPKEGPPLSEALKDAWAVVCPFSVAGVEAAVAGYPVFSTELCPTWPISQDLAGIEDPQEPERYEWANSLAAASWHVSELSGINFKEYQCA